MSRVRDWKMFILTENFQKIPIIPELHQIAKTSAAQAHKDYLMLKRRGKIAYEFTQ